MGIFCIGIKMVFHGILTYSSDWYSRNQLERCTAFGTTEYATGAEGSKGATREPTLILCEIRPIRKDAERP